MAHPFWPIIYVRGYAMSRDEIDETTADPFCGFNLGSTVYRATVDKDRPAKFIFESPVVRLAAEYGYSCVFDAGRDIVDEGFQKKRIPARSIIIYRYYDEASRLLGTGKTPNIRKFGADLGALIDRVRDLVCAPREKDDDEVVAKADFRCYLVAHSMGGLVCRTFLQAAATAKDLRQCVDKVFTYATPHNGIDMAGINVPEWLNLNDINNFSRENIADYLDLKPFFAATGRVDWLPQSPQSFDAKRFFCMIGTNRADYEVAMGLSRSFAGHGSDGLVRIENASVWGIDAATMTVSEPCATAYAYRSHSGFFGIVNSEEAYQNLARFLFGNARIDVYLDIDSVRLPRDVEQKRTVERRKVNALYRIRLCATLRKCRWYLTRRVAEEDSVACRTLEDLESPDPGKRATYLSTIFLSRRVPQNQALQSLAFQLDFGVGVQDYQIDRAFWSDEHFEGAQLYGDILNIEVMPPAAANNAWTAAYTSQNDQQAGAAQPSYPLALRPHPDGERLIAEIGFQNPGSPGISGKLRFVAGKWN